MANRFTTPFPQFFDATPEVRTGAKLFFYAAGTSTPLNTYSDSALTVANTNPIILNALGQPDIAIFLSNLAYKCVLKTSDDVEVWTSDNVWSSDFSTVAQVQSVNGSPNGQLSGTQGSLGVPASAAWDYVGSILYICTSTGNAATAVWTAINSGSTANVVTPPLGRLTLSSSLPVTVADVVSATVLYYTPYVGNLVPIFSGAVFVPTSFAELSLTLVSSHSADSNYDIFCFNNLGTLVLGTGPAWSTASSRGSGAGTTELTRLYGLHVNTVAMTLRNGSTTYSVGANRATYLGTIRIGSSNGIVDDSGTRRFVWNTYNRVSRAMAALEPTASWVYSSATARISNGNAANRLQMVTGLQEDLLRCVARSEAVNDGPTPRTVGIMINVDAPGGAGGDSSTVAAWDSCTNTKIGHLVAEYIGFQNIGWSQAAWWEKGAGLDSQTWFGGISTGAQHLGILGEIRA